MNACAKPRLPSWACATSPITMHRPRSGWPPGRGGKASRNRVFTTSDDIGECPLHPAEVEGSREEPHGCRHGAREDHRPRPLAASEKRPPEPLDDASHRIQAVNPDREVKLPQATRDLTHRVDERGG